MLQNIREGIQGPWAIGIIALIVVSFVFTGVGSYISSNNTSAVAVVNGEEITASALENAYQNERGRLESQFGDAISSLFASESYVTQFRSDLLERLIGEKLVSQKASELGLRVSDEQIRDAIRAMPEFQVAGNFDNTIYLSAINRAGYTPSGFAELMRGQMTRQQLVQAINGTNFGMDYQVAKVLLLENQTRTAKSIEIDLAKYKDSVEVSEDEIQAYYDQNLSNFDTMEQVKLAYVSLSIADLESRVEVSSEEIKQYYQDNIKVYTTDEVKTVSHILFEIEDDAQATMAEAEQVLDRLNSGEDFAKVAEDVSDDLLSAEVGGDLGEVTAEDYPGAFGEAIQALANVGQLSNIVESEFGLHIIKLTGFTPSKIIELSEVEQQIEQELRINKATDEYFVLQQDMAQLAFEQPDSLEAVAKAVDKPIIESGFFEPGRLPAGLNYPQIADIAFSSQLVDAGFNSDLLELSNDTVMVVRVAQYNPQTTRSLEEVSEQIKRQLKSDKAQQQALEYAQSIQIAIYEDQDVTELLAQHDIVWETHEGILRSTNSLPLDMVNAIFQLSPAQGMNSSVVTLGNGNIGVVQLLEVQEVDGVDISSTQANTIKQRITGLTAQQTYQNFVNALRSDAKIQIVSQ